MSKKQYGPDEMEMVLQHVKDGTMDDEMKSETNRTEFKSMEKIHRLYREVVITEKIDGTNAHIHISTDGEIRAASRNRYLTLDSDNYGFAAWVMENRDRLMALGPGRHYGEWWGRGIQRQYGQPERHFSLFHVDRYAETIGENNCVPVLYRGVFSDDAVRDCLSQLDKNGSVAGNGFQRAEGIVVYHVGSRQCYKITLDGDGHKGAKP